MHSEAEGHEILEILLWMNWKMKNSKIHPFIDSSTRFRYMCRWWHAAIQLPYFHLSYQTKMCLLKDIFYKISRCFCFHYQNRPRHFPFHNNTFETADMILIRKFALLARCVRRCQKHVVVKFSTLPIKCDRATYETGDSLFRPDDIKRPQIEIWVCDFIALLFHLVSMIGDRMKIFFTTTAAIGTKELFLTKKKYKLFIFFGAEVANAAYSREGKNIWENFGFFPSRYERNSCVVVQPFFKKNSRLLDERCQNLNLKIFFFSFKLVDIQIF